MNANTWLWPLLMQDPILTSMHEAVSCAYLFCIPKPTPISNLNSDRTGHLLCGKTRFEQMLLRNEEPSTLLHAHAPYLWGVSCPRAAAIRLGFLSWKSTLETDGGFIVCALFRNIQVSHRATCSPAILHPSDLVHGAWNLVAHSKTYSFPVYSKSDISFVFQTHTAFYFSSLPSKRYTN